MRELIGISGEKTLSEIGNEAQIVSMGHQACGALDLWNYPVWMRNLIAQDPNGQDRPDHVDMPALESKRSLAHNPPFKIILKSVKFWVPCYYLIELDFGVFFSLS